MGLHKEARKMFSSSVLNYTISARTAQGYNDLQTSTHEERRDIVARWKLHKSELQSPKLNMMDQGGPDGQESGHLTPKGFFQTRSLTFDERKKLSEERKVKRLEERKKVQSKDGHRSCPFCRRDKPHTHTPRAVQSDADAASVENFPIESEAPHVETNEEFEAAIHESVAATSRGNPEEDIMIERAIRASVRELQKSTGSSLTDQEALARAIQASVAEAGRNRRPSQAVETSAPEPIGMTDEEEAEHEALLEKAIQESLASYQLPPPRDVDDIDTDDDENVKLAIQMSKHTPPEINPDSEDDEDIKLAIQKSKEEHAKAKTEEEIVLEYVKKQSLAEEEHKKAVAGKKKEGESDADEEALREAIRESMRVEGKDGEASGL
jgi:hypothetical protein